MLRLGIIGCGRAANLSLLAILVHPDVELVGVTDADEILAKDFARDAGTTSYRDTDALLRNDEIDAVYVAVPHEHHESVTVQCLNAGKHVLVEKPMALSLEACDRMVATAERCERALVVGHTNGFDPPILALRELALSGVFGRVGMVLTQNYSNFLYRPRRPEELDTELGGGIMFNAFPHQVDMMRTIVPSTVTRVSAVCGRWDEGRPTEGSVSAMLRFDSDAVATIVFSGWAHLDSRLLYSGLDETSISIDEFVAARAKLATVESSDEAAARRKGDVDARRRLLTSASSRSIANSPHERFGVTIVGFEHADVVPGPSDLVCYTDAGIEHLPVTSGTGGERHSTVFDEFTAACRGDGALHDGRWGRETMRICLAALSSARLGREVAI